MLRNFGGTSLSVNIAECGSSSTIRLLWLHEYRLIYCCTYVVGLLSVSLRPVMSQTIRSLLGITRVEARSSAVPDWPDIDNISAGKRLDELVSGDEEERGYFVVGPLLCSGVAEYEDYGDEYNFKK